MTKEEFKQRWESNERGGGITFNDIADCAVAWGICSSPRTSDIEMVMYKVLIAANVEDAEDFTPILEDE